MEQIEKPVLVFKIQSIKTGLFSTGGSCPTWKKKGKTWTAKSHISSHFTQLGQYGRSIYRALEAQVITYELKQTAVETSDIEHWIAQVEVREQKRKQEYLEASQKRERERDLRQLAELQKKYSTVS